MRLHQAGPRLTLTVADDGIGFDPETLMLSRPASGGMGLRGIEVRVRILHARFSQQSAPGQGTRTLIELETSPTL